MYFYITHLISILKEKLKAYLLQNQSIKRN